MAVSGVSGRTDILNSLTNAQIAKENSTGNEFEKTLEEATKAASGKTTSSMTSAEKKQYDEKLKQTCKDMESIYINQMFKIMQDSVQKSGLVPESQAESMMRSMQTDEMSKDMAKAGGIGIADMMYKQLSLEEKDRQKALAQEKIASAKKNSN